MPMKQYTCLRSKDNIIRHQRLEQGEELTFLILKLVFYTHRFFIAVGKPLLVRKRKIKKQFEILYILKLLSLR